MTTTTSTSKKAASARALSSSAPTSSTIPSSPSHLLSMLALRLCRRRQRRPALYACCYVFYFACFLFGYTHVLTVRSATPPTNAPSSPISAVPLASPTPAMRLFFVRFPWFGGFSGGFFAGWSIMLLVWGGGERAGSLAFSRGDGLD